METAKLKKFAQFARRSLMEQVASKLKLVLAENSAARRERAEAIKKLEEAIKNHGKEQVIERVAYIWFNRFSALRFMDVNRYTRISVVSPAEGQFQPEILAEAKMGHVDDEMVHDKVRQQIFDLLNGKSPSRDPQGEAYRLLVVAACNYWNKAMPFLFERIDDYTELLMPDDLLSGSSILANTREAMTPDACVDVEVIGWLYQFYISEKKDEVINRRSVVKKEEIPAATQLFTPKWIVEYMVDNSLGRLWLLNRPRSKLSEQMDYYIKPDQTEMDFLRIAKPEEIKICDPACGSGHMLTYAFDLLYSIYDEEGYEPAEIPEKILTHNLYGIEIDERAGELAAFALSMKALEYDKRFFTRAARHGKSIEPNICVLQNIKFENIPTRDTLFDTQHRGTSELDAYMDFVGRDLFTSQLQATLCQFEEADNFGSLIRPDVTDVDSMLRILELKNISGNLFLSRTHQKVLQSLQQADYLSPKYHVVIANPPYAGSRYMNPRLRAYAQSAYPDSKTDMFTMFIERIAELSLDKGIFAVVCPFVWMYISTYEKFRESLLNIGAISSLVRLEYNAFEPACVPVATWVFLKNQTTLGTYIDLSAFKGHQYQAPKTLEAIELEAENTAVSYLYKANSLDFSQIPGTPIAYQAGHRFREMFSNGLKLGDVCDFTGSQNKTSNNNQYLRMHWEVSQADIGKDSRWVLYAKGGGERKWYGLLINVVDWSDISRAFYKDNPTSNLLAETFWFRPGITYSELTSNTATFRILPKDCVYDMTGPSFHPNAGYQEILLLACNSIVAEKVFGMLNPTIHLQARDVKNLPLPTFSDEEVNIAKRVYENIINISISDWDEHELSRDFSHCKIFDFCALKKSTKIIDAYYKLRQYWQTNLTNLRDLEIENNKLFISAFHLDGEFESDISIADINLTCNPHGRFGVNKNDEELEALLLADTMRELVSYAVGCMFGRYALEKTGLILANQGETVEDYIKRVPEPIFSVDEDNVIPMLEGDWFTDDIAERFHHFLRVAFGEEHSEANLKFVEMALGKNGKARDIRDYFLKDFYRDHVKRYKKRPIYWLFSSPKGSFNALIYMHRYRPDTVSVVLNDYLREFRTKLTSQRNHLEAVSISASASQGEKAKALKKIEKISKMIVEMEEYEREVLYPLATEQVIIDLDEGVKANYPKLGAALKKIPGLDAAR